MIEGMFFHLSGKEMSELMIKRAEWHAGQAVERGKDLEVASQAMEIAREAGAKAGRTNSSKRSMNLEVASARGGGGGPARNYGESVEDPITALEEAIKFHCNRASALKFYANHLLADEIYKLRDHDLVQYELLVMEE